MRRRDSARTAMAYMATWALAVGVAGAATGDRTTDERPCFSGIYPHLAVSNGRDTECGIGAVVPWAGSLWYVTYSAHMPFGSDDKLFQLDVDLNATVRSESVGGTPANRMIHPESNQLIIGSHLIDADGRVRTIPFAEMPGRMNATVRHLTDPADKVYFVTMEEGLYEVDVHTLEVTTLHLDRNAGGGDLWPGDHGKGAYTGQGRLIASNNGHGGALVEWTGQGDPGTPEVWTLVDRNKYTDVAGPGGLRGVQGPDDPVWAVGWDAKSVLLSVCDKGGRWTRYRLPKASFTHDADHGWFTEWPRIRDIGDGPWLMDMHGMFYDFPPTFDHEHAAGIRPISTFLKMVVDFAAWGDRLVFACNDASPFDNPLLGRNQSNLWFADRRTLGELGPATGYGSVWAHETVRAEAPSEPFLIAGFAERTVHLAHGASGPVTFTLEIDADGSGHWEVHREVEVPAQGYAFVILDASVRAEWMRLRIDRDAPDVTACFHVANRPAAARTALIAGLAPADGPGAWSRGLIRPRNTDDLTLHLAADILDASGRITGAGYYEIGQEMNLRRVADASAETWLRSTAATTQDFTIDAASVIVMDGQGRRRRLPRGTAAFDEPIASAWPRGIREVVTERGLMNVHGTFYELPRPASGGLARIRPVCTHNRRIHDFCSWRGMLVLAGIRADAPSGEHIVRGDDGRAALWFGNVDDLWRFGPPRGTGGPWMNSPVAAETPSDPYLMTGYDRKTVEMSHDADTPVRMTLEVDVLADDSWHAYQTFTVPPGRTVQHTFPKGYSAHWVRARTDTPCRATVQFDYTAFWPVWY